MIVVTCDATGNKRFDNVPVIPWCEIVLIISATMPATILNVLNE